MHRGRGETWAATAVVYSSQQSSPRCWWVWTRIRHRQQPFRPSGFCSRVLAVILLQSITDWWTMMGPVGVIERLHFEEILNVRVIEEWPSYPCLATRQTTVACRRVSDTCLATRQTTVACRRVSDTCLATRQTRRVHLATG